jgi:MFS family permease
MHRAPGASYQIYQSDWRTAPSAAVFQLTMSHLRTGMARGAPAWHGWSISSDYARPSVTAPNASASSPEHNQRFLAGLVGLTFLMNAIGRGVTETFAIYLLPVEAALGVDRGQIAATYSIYMVAYGVAAPFVGQLIDRMGARLCYALGLLTLGIGYVVGAHADSIWHYYLGVGVLGGLGAAGLSMVAASSLLSRWFSTRLGTMSAVPYAAVGAGMLVFPPLTQWLLATYDWRTVQTWQGMLVLAIVPLLFLLPMSRYNAGSDAWRALKIQTATTLAASGATGWTVSAAIRTRAFWMLFLAYFATSVAAYSVLPHSVAFLVERGFAPQVAAWAFGATGVLSVIGIMATGWLSDRIGRLPVVTLSYIITITGILSLLAVEAMPSLVFVYGFVLCFGLMQGARGPILVALVAKIFAGGSVGAIFGTLSLALGLGAGAGSLMSGTLHTYSGSYGLSFSMAAAASAIGLATFWLAPSLRQERVATPDVTATPASQGH